MQDLTPQMTGSMPFPREIEGVLKLDNVSFRYAGATRNVVDGVSLEVPARTYIGITGQTSSGRTTLLKLLNGLLTPHEGSIRYDDVPLCLFAPQELRRQIALMPTSPTIYAGTLLENLTLFEDGPVKRRALALVPCARPRRLCGRAQSRPRDTAQRGERHADGYRPAHLDRPRRWRKIRASCCSTRRTSALDHEADRMLLAFFERQKGKRAAVFVTDRPSYLRIVRYGLRNGGRAA